MRIYFKDPIYDVHYFVYIDRESWDFEKVKKDVTKTVSMTARDKVDIFKHLKEIFPTNQEGVCYHNSDIVLIFLKDFKDSPYWYSILSHEVFHATQFVFEMLNTPLSKDTSEPFAYYNGFLHRKIYEQLWDPKFIAKQEKVTL